MVGKLAKQLEHVLVHRVLSAFCILNATIVLIRSNSMRVYLNWITISIIRGKNGAGDEIDRVDGCEADGGHP